MYFQRKDQTHYVQVLLMLASLLSVIQDSVMATILQHERIGFINIWTIFCKWSQKVRIVIWTNTQHWGYYVTSERIHMLWQPKQTNSSKYILVIVWFLGLLHHLELSHSGVSYRFVRQGPKTNWKYKLYYIFIWRPLDDLMFSFILIIVRSPWLYKIYITSLTNIFISPRTTIFWKSTYIYTRTKN